MEKLAGKFEIRFQVNHKQLSSKAALFYRGIKNAAHGGVQQ